MNNITVNNAVCTYDVYLRIFFLYSPSNNIFSSTVVALIGLFELGVIPTHKSGFYCNDPALDFPFTGDTVNSVTLLSTVFGLPLIFVSRH